MCEASLACDNSQRSLSVQQQEQEFAEDKKCRICGMADMRNVNIFSPGNCRQLVTKILTVYPIVLYKNDPLPKNICKKCITNVSVMYNDILRVMRMQIKWINNVRSVQPHHNYIRVLDLIQNTNAVTRESIKDTLGEDVNDLNVSRLLFVNKTVSLSPTKKSEVFKKNATENQPSSKGISTSFSIDFPDKASIESSDCSPPKVAKKKESYRLPTDPTGIKDIKNLLEQNGCSLLHVNAVKTSSQNAASSSVKSGVFPPTAVKIKEEQIDSQSDKILLSLLSGPSKGVNSPPATSAPLPGPPPPLTVKCRLCPLQFNSLSSLATHQIIHMRLSSPKIFQKKYLHKRVRRGRLISVQERKCIRCLNCWRIFVDNKSILEHWGLGECDFYCHICGKEFAQAPKMLREHVPAVHGISYRSSKFPRVRLSTKIIMSMSQTSAADNSDYKLYQAVSEQEPLPSEELVGGLEQSKLKDGDTKQLSSTLPASTSSAEVAASSTSKVTSPQSKKSSEVTQNKGGTVSCHICLKPFQNFKARNSHMRKHKPVYAYGDMVLPPVSGVNPYVKDDGDEDDPDYAEDSLTFKDFNTKEQTSQKPQQHSTPQNKSDPQTIKPASTSGSTQLRGVRTKFVKPRSELNSSKIGFGGSGLGSCALKVKSLNELQNPSTSDSTNTWLPSSATAQQKSSAPITTTREIKTEPIDVDHPNEQTTFTCIPCSDQFSSKLELFRHKRKCRASYIIPCEYCSKSFRCSADYQLHVGQNHRNSNQN